MTTHHIAFRKNGRTLKKMGDYPSVEAAAADAKAMLAAGTIPAGIQVFACRGSSAGVKANPRRKPAAAAKPRARANPLRLTPKDRAAIKAFGERRAHEGTHLRSTGAALDSIGWGGRVASWSGGVVVLAPIGTKYGETFARAIRKELPASAFAKKNPKRNPKVKQYALGGGWYGTIGHGGVGSGGVYTGDADADVQAHGFSVWRPWGGAQPAMTDLFAGSLARAKANAKQWIRDNFEQQMRSKYGPFATDRIVEMRKALKIKTPTTRYNPTKKKAAKPKIKARGVLKLNPTRKAKKAPARKKAPAAKKRLR